MYIRYSCGKEGQDLKTFNGFITQLAILMDGKELAPHELDLTNDFFSWLNEKLPCPPWSKRGDWWTEDAISWFKESATEFTSMMHCVSGILEDHGFKVHIIETDDPGVIVYSDQYQVVAETDRKKPF